ncbi:MAG: amidophosphoribosyltransferase [Candidatus Rokubacteria bacterium]|nr:amidophosphoribosyltransferase [Candidatus Rokubacteria bacterium]
MSPRDRGRSRTGSRIPLGGGSPRSPERSEWGGFAAGRRKGGGAPLREWKDECGIFGIWNHPEAANLTYLGLYALQHRGQESAGIAATDGRVFHVEKAMGWVADVFHRERLKRLPGTAAIGHVRYSTAGTSTLKNAQPITANTARGPIAIAHNGNLVNAEALKAALEKDGSVFQSNSDTEVILHLLARASGSTLEEQLPQALGRVTGAYSLLILTPEAVVAIRDPHGFRPLSLGKLGDAWIVASETCALDLLEATFVRDVEPGEIVFITAQGLRSFTPFPPKERLQCVFEYVYFSRPDSLLWGRNVHAVRMTMGHQLAREHPAQADIVIPVPDSGMGAALGFSEESGIPFQVGLIRNHYVGRTFIEPERGIRHFGVMVKLNPMRETLGGRRVVVVDDSIVRGTTSRKIVKMIRSAGAREVHVRISSPPIHWPCYYGIDTPTRKELIASSHAVEEIRRYLGADSLGYLSLDGMLKSTGSDPSQFCHACFTGNYRVGFEREVTPQLSLFDG